MSEIVRGFLKYQELTGFTFVVVVVAVFGSQVDIRGIYAENDLGEIDRK